MNQHLWDDAIVMVPGPTSGKVLKTDQLINHCIAVSREERITENCALDNA